MRLPHTSEKRHDRGFLRLLTFVHPAAPAGLQFDGQLLTPGAEFEPAELPRPAVALEYAGATRIARPHSRYSFAALWVLWRFDFDRVLWLEIVRTTAHDSSWSIDFAPIAYRHLHAVPEAPAEERSIAIVGRLCAAIGDELARVARDVRAYVLGGLDRYIAGEIVRVSEPIGITRIGPGCARIGGSFSESAFRARGVQ